MELIHWISTMTETANALYFPSQRSRHLADTHEWPHSEWIEENWSRYNLLHCLCEYNVCVTTHNTLLTVHIELHSQFSLLADTVIQSYSQWEREQEWVWFLKISDIPKLTSVRWGKSNEEIAEWLLGTGIRNVCPFLFYQDRTKLHVLMFSD